MFHYMHLAGKLKSFIVKHFPSRSKQSLQCVDSNKDDIHPNFGTPKCSKKHGHEKKKCRCHKLKFFL